MGYEAKPRHIEKPLKQRPDKGRDVRDDHEPVYDSAERPLLPHEMEPALRQQVEEQLDAPLRERADDIVTKRLEITGNMDEEWDRLVGQMGRTSRLMKEMRANARKHPDAPTTPIENGAQQLKLIRFQLEALAKHRARQRLLSNLSGGYSAKDLLGHIKKSRDLHRERLGKREGAEEKVEDAAMLILRNAENKLLEEVAQNPDRVSELRQEQDKLMNEVLKRAGGIGGTAEVSFTPSKKTPAAEAKLRDFTKQMHEVEQQLQDLSWFERMFGSGKTLRSRLAEMKREHKVMRMNINAERVGKALSDMPSASTPELPDKNIAPVENTWKLYQTELASLSSLQQRRAKLSRLPWKDRQEKARLAKLMNQSEQRAKELKTQHAQEIREQNLAREKQEEELRKQLEG